MTFTYTYILIYPYSIHIQPQVSNKVHPISALEILRYYLGDIRLFKMSLTLN